MGLEKFSNGINCLKIQESNAISSKFQLKKSKLAKKFPSAINYKGVEKYKMED